MLTSRCRAKGRKAEGRRGPGIRPSYFIVPISHWHSGDQGNPTYDTKQSIAVMHEKHGIACDVVHGFTWDKWTAGMPTERLQLIPAGQEHILEHKDGKKRWVQVVSELSANGA